MSAQATPPQPRPSALAPLYVGAGALAYAVLIWFASKHPGGRVDLFERGNWLGPASDMLAGKVPYRDTFPVHGFLSDGGLDFLLFKLWGPDFAVSLRAHHFLGILFQPALFLVTAALLRRVWLSALAIPINFAVATALVADRPVLPLLGLAAFLWAADEDHSGWRAFFAGALSALGFLYALEFGTFVLLAEILGLALSRLAARSRPAPVRLRWYAAGLGAIAVPFLTYLAVHGALAAFITTSFVDLPSQIGDVWGWAFPAPWDLARAWLDGRTLTVGGLPVGLGIAKRMYLTVLVGAAGLVIAVWLHRRTRLRLESFRLATASLACVFFFRYVIARLHLEAGNALVGPVFVASVVLLYRAAATTGYPRPMPLRIAALLSCLALAVSMNGPARLLGLVRAAAGYPERMRQVEGLHPITIPRGGSVLVPEPEVRELSALVEACDRWVPRNASILDLSNRPGLFFFLDRPNATRFYQVALMEPFQSTVLAEIRARPPALVILDEAEAAAQERMPRIAEYVRRNFPRTLPIGSNVFRLPPEEPATRASPEASPRPTGPGTR